MNRIALITGVTSGIGEATAYRFAEVGINLILTGRRGDRLYKLENELKNKNIEILTLEFDVRNKEEVKSAISNLPKKWKNIDILVNNAGLAVGTNPIQNGIIDDWERMIDTNIKGLLYMTREIAPRMVERNSGHIVNIASIAGKEIYPGGNVYCASKHAVDALSRAMRIDMVNHSIKVTNIAPGMAETEFSIVRYKGDENAAKNVYNGFVPLCADDIADAIQYVVTRPAHVCINDLLIMPTAQASSRDVKRN